LVFGEARGGFVGIVEAAKEVVDALFGGEVEEVGVGEARGFAGNIAALGDPGRRIVGALGDPVVEGDGGGGGRPGGGEELAAGEHRDKRSSRSSNVSIAFKKLTSGSRYGNVER